MKKVLIDPSAILSIKCPHCNSPGKVKRNKMYFKDFVVNCPKCTKQFIAVINTRHCYRKRVSIDVYYSLKEIRFPLDSKVQSGTIVNISKYGCLLETHVSKYSSKSSTEKKGNILTLLFFLPPKNDKLTLRGKIKRVSVNPENDKKTIGVEFIELTEHQAKEIGFFFM